MCVNARSEDLPIDTVAMLGTDHGLLTAAVQVACRDPKSEPPAEANQVQRFAAAHRLVGGAAAETLWQFPVPQDFYNARKDDLLKFWDGLHGGAAAQQLLRQLVLAIRIWQPDVIFTDNPDCNVTGSASSALVAEAMHEAFKQAADPRAFPEQIEQLGLEPWRASRVYGQWDQRDGSHVVIETNKEIPQLQVTYAEHAAGAGGMLGSTSPVVPAHRFYRLLDTGHIPPGTDKTVLAAVNFGKVGVCRRQMSAEDETDANLVPALKAQRQLLALARNPAAGLTEAPRLLDQLGAMLAKLPEDRVRQGGEHYGQ